MSGKGTFPRPKKDFFVPLREKNAKEWPNDWPFLSETGEDK
jgi:hypothetical protein